MNEVFIYFNTQVLIPDTATEFLEKVNDHEYKTKGEVKADNGFLVITIDHDKNSKTPRRSIYFPAHTVVRVDVQPK